MNECVLISPVCPYACSDLSELFGDEENMPDRQKVMCALQGQQGLVRDLITTSVSAV